ncbi:ADP-heptose--LPS heptosyltransferase [Bryobacterales bacterium F-183]|nr:ADP-heptose--LPS heptosyltransferase [Bryobacterales bacterium F-183]
MPAMEALRSTYSDAHITVLARSSVAELYTGSPVCDQVLLYKPQSWKDRWKLSRVLKHVVFDTAILLPNSLESAIVPFLARIPRRIGYARDGRSLLLTDAIPVPPRDGKTHERYYYLELLHRAGLIAEVPLDAPVRLSRGDMREDVIGISPGAAYGTAKRWHAASFADAAAELAGRLQCRVAVFGTPAEADVCQEVATLLRAKHVDAESYAGKTNLREFVDHASRCRLFLTNDNGAMHVASALGVPTVAIFGATNHVTTGPAEQNSVVVRQAVDCSPHKNPCLLRECPIDHRCMTAVTPQRVVEEALRILG